MIKILVCFKIVHDFEGITPSELRALRDGTLNISLFKKIINSYDEAALETARRLKEYILPFHSCELHAVTIGACELRFAKELYAVGFDKIINILPSKPECNSEEVALHLYNLLQINGGYSAILAGKQAWPGENGLMPYILANKLGIPSFSQITQLQWKNGIRMTMKTDSGELTCTANTPAIYIIGDAVHPYLKIATLREKLETKHLTLYTIEPSTLSPRMDLGKVRKLLYEKQERQCRFVEGENLHEKVEIFLKEVISQWEKS